jgi:tight adherence protein C
MSAGAIVTLAAFLAGSSLVYLCFLVVGDRNLRLENRLRHLASEATATPADMRALTKLAQTTLPKMGTPFIPSDAEERTKLQTRLIHAGLYGRQAMVVFLGVKVFLMVLPAVLGISAGLLGLVPTNVAVLSGASLGIFGMIGPSFWLDRQKAKRQSNFRRALPDALDLFVICLEGGLSLPGSLRRISTELRTAHPVLATELNIVQREIQLGRSPGEALRKMGERADLEEVRSLSAVIIQAERFGASLTTALRVHSDALRIKRQQRAEAMAQTAGTKVLFPTVLFILPAMFVIILGPAIIHILEVFRRMGF